MVYTAGYSSGEFHGTDTIVDAGGIWEAVLEEAVRRSRTAFIWSKKNAAGFLAGPIVSEGLGDYNYSIDSSLSGKMFGSAWDLMGASKEKLQSFVNYGLEL